MWQLNDKPYHAGVGTNSTRGWPSQRRKNYSVWPRKTVIGRPVYLLSLTKVNFIELLCTAGLPAMYTAILTQQGLPPLAHYGLVLYIVAYVADDTLMVARPAPRPLAQVAQWGRDASVGSGDVVTARMVVLTSINCRSWVVAVRLLRVLAQRLRPVYG